MNLASTDFALAATHGTPLRSSSFVSPASTASESTTTTPLITASGRTGAEVPPQHAQKNAPPDPAGPRCTHRQLSPNQFGLRLWSYPWRL
ncbi:hypothetical protein LIER_29564 [Lithospermum erythrorhizon]|uniref:Uncharacterized protein n=1 Tax=Lithospermum erythrorhizon TaxID=34254 RepID=A0AAV3RN45_LITER